MALRPLKLVIFDATDTPRAARARRLAPGAAGDRVVLTTGNDGNVVITGLGVMVTPGGSVISLSRGKG